MPLPTWTRQYSGITVLLESGSPTFEADGIRLHLAAATAAMPGGLQIDSELPGPLSDRRVSEVKFASQLPPGPGPGPGREILCECPLTSRPRAGSCDDVDSAGPSRQRPAVGHT